MTTTSIGGKRFNPDVAADVLRKNDISPTKANVAKLVSATPDLNGGGYLSRGELQKGVQNLDGVVGRPKKTGTLTTPIKSVLTQTKIPASIRENYNVFISDDRKKLTFNPPVFPDRVRTRGARGIIAEDTLEGGKRIQLEGGPFKNGKWVTKSLGSVVKDPDQRAELLAAGYDLDAKRPLLVVNGENDPNPTYFALSRDESSRGLVAICSEVTVLDFATGSPTVMVRKPVIYLYPEKKQQIRAKVEIAGKFTALYPATEDGTWNVVATPDGTLFDPKTERRFSYLFWEGENSRPFAIDRKQAFCVRREDTERFLEKAAARFGLNTKETTDFVSYWIAPMSQNAINLVQFLDVAEYERYAKLEISPTPDTLIRMFMIFQRTPELVACGEPALPSLSRRGFTAVEWGGSNLDEHVH